ncbi:MAG: glycosyltransferase family A protein [Bacillota bacterium]|nr:glycosyltransferase family A protein [Bacillota bacterium]
MTIQYSVVMPTFNRKEQLMLTLASFENQTFPMDQFEVIVVDDGSTDGTDAEIRNYHPPYTLQYLSTGNWSGIPAAWNLGVKNATSPNIIFCDADFFVLPHFIETHHQYIVNHPDAVISSIPNCGRGIYLQIFPEYAFEEKEWIANLLRQVGLWDDSYFSSNQVVKIVNEDDVRDNLEKVLKAVCPVDYFPQVLREEYAKTDVAPWVLAINRSLSVQKKYIERAGWFDERLVRGGDWDMGYRLDKMGLPFISVDKIVGYHQEHPNLFRKQITKTGESHLKIILDKYGAEDPELSLQTFFSPWDEGKQFKDMLRILHTLKQGTGFQKRLADSFINDLKKIALEIVR